MKDRNHVWILAAMVAVALVALLAMYKLSFGAVPPVGKMLEPNHSNLSAQESLELYEAKQEGYVPIFKHLQPDLDYQRGDYIGSDYNTSSPVPEPVTMVMVSTGLLVIGWARRR